MLYLKTQPPFEKYFAKPFAETRSLLHLVDNQLFRLPWLAPEARRISLAKRITRKDESDDFIESLTACRRPNSI